MNRISKFKAVFLIVLFAALSLLLNFYGPKISAPYMPSFLYYLWEIPIVTAFILYGVKVGVISALASVLVPFVVSKENPMPNLFYCLAATISMLFGIGIAKFYVSKRSPKNDLALAAMFTFSGAVLRTALVALVFLAFLGASPPLGFSFPEPATAITIINRIVYDFSLALYTIPLGYFLAYCFKFLPKKFRLAQKISPTRQS